MASNIIPMHWIGLTPSSLGSPGYADKKEEGNCEKEVIFPNCEFCDARCTGNTYDIGSRGKRWFICLSSRCWEAANAQKDRIYNGLVDCEQTRADVLRWIDNKNKKK